MCTDKCTYNRWMANKEARVEVRATEDDVRRWREAAAAEDMTVSEWIRRLCNRETPSAADIRDRRATGAARKERDARSEARRAARTKGNK